MRLDEIFGRDKWLQCKTEDFWDNIVQTDHLIQIYENEEVILNSLLGFCESGLRKGDTVIILAREHRLEALDKRLKAHGFDLEELKLSYQYVPLNAHEILSYFMEDGWPNEMAFNQIVKGLLSLAHGKPKDKIRLYGEMVAILMTQGYTGATVQLEHLWNKFCETEGFCLYCAYPKNSFNPNSEKTLEHISYTHTKMISGVHRSRTEVFYRDINK